MRILVTGGAGYIGSHTLIELISTGYSVIVLDNFSNSSPKVIKRVERIVHTPIPCYNFDLQNKELLAKLFKKERFDAVIHFAGLKAVGESMANPLLYYRTNINSTLSLLEVMEMYNVQTLVFSSSATVYGSASIPYTEKSPTGQGITNPYGQSKYMIEQILRDTAAAHTGNRFTILRYFNPIGAHPSCLIGEHPQGVPNNLMPYLTQVATGKRDFLSVFGNYSYFFAND